MGTGIVFVVLVAIWVAYFVQYWSRRREHLATARSVESFAEAMRVLERRPALAGRRSAAYAVSPARVHHPAPRPQVMAKPHAMASQSRLSSRVAPSPSPSAVRAAGSRMSKPTAPSPAPMSRTSATGGSPKLRTSYAMSPSRKVRGLSLLGSLVATVVFGVLAALQVVLWWVPLVSLAAVAATFLWLRAGVQGEIAARRAASRARRARRSTGAGAARHAAGAPRSDNDGLERSGVGHQDPAEAAEAAEAAAAATHQPIHGHEVSTADSAGPGGWQPVPVPPPTYTLKAKAERPAHASVQPAVPAAAEAEGRSEPAAPVSADAHQGHPLALPGDGEGEAPRSAAYGT